MTIITGANYNIKYVDLPTIGSDCHSYGLVTFMCYRIFYDTTISSSITTVSRTSLLEGGVCVTVTLMCVISPTHRIPYN